VTIQDNGIDGALAGPVNNLVTVTSYDPGGEGTYVYDLATDRFLRISDAVSSYGFWAAAPNGELSWSTR
jgi:hypothetical protein